MDESCEGANNRKVSSCEDVGMICVQETTGGGLEVFILCGKGRVGGEMSMSLSVSVPVAVVVAVARQVNAR